MTFVRLNWHHLRLNWHHLRLRWHLLIESDKISSACLDSSKQFCLSSSHLEKKKAFLSKRKVFSFNFSFFQLHEMKTIDNIFAFSIICFNASIRSHSKWLLSALDLVVLVFVLVLLVSLVSLVFVLCLCHVFCLRLNQLDEQRALSSYSSFHLT